jgi:hypothetical protein
MTKVWGATSTTDDVLSGIDLHGKRILVTGVSAGIGVETARALAAHGAHVTGAARDLEKAEAATAQVRKDAAANGGSFELVALDLASLNSVRACAGQLLARGEDEPSSIIIPSLQPHATIARSSVEPWKASDRPTATVVVRLPSPQLRCFTHFQYFVASVRVPNGLESFGRVCRAKALRSGSRPFAISY